MRGKRIEKSIVVIALVMMSGCASSQKAKQPVEQRARFVDQAPARSLVLPSERMMELSAISGHDQIDPRDNAMGEQLEFARNDQRLGAVAESRFDGFQFVEVRSREFLHTINGRPSEYSTTYTRSLKVGRPR